MLSAKDKNNIKDAIFEELVSYDGSTTWSNIEVELTDGNKISLEFYGWVETDEKSGFGYYTPPTSYIKDYSIELNDALILTDVECDDWEEIEGELYVSILQIFDDAVSEYIKNY